MVFYMSTGALPNAMYCMLDLSLTLDSVARTGCFGQRKLEPPGDATLDPGPANESSMARIEAEAFPSASLVEKLEQTSCRSFATEAWLILPASKIRTLLHWVRHRNSSGPELWFTKINFMYH